MDKPLYVCMVGSSFEVRGGMTSVCRQLSSHHFGNGIQIEYLATHEFGPKIHRCMVFIRGYRKMFRLLRAGKVDLVHLHMSERGSFFRKNALLHLAKRFHKPVVLHMHGAEFRVFYENSPKFLQKKIRKLLRDADRVVVLGKHWDDVVHKIEPKTRTLIINNAVSIPDLSATWDEAETHLCYMAVLIPRKGIADLLDAFRLLLDRKDLPRPVRLTVAGSGSESEAMIQKCKDLGMSNFVSFAGWTAGEAKMTQLLSSQCFILPSYNEGLPVAILEALSCGLPVISTNVGSIDEAVIDNVNGRFIPVHNPQALADAIVDVISTRERWESLSAGAKKSARDNFDENQLFDTLEKLYLSLASEEKS